MLVGQKELTLERNATRQIREIELTVAMTRYMHLGFFVCGAIAVIFYLLANVAGAIVLSIIGLGFEVASYVLMFQAWHDHRGS